MGNVTASPIMCLALSLLLVSCGGGGGGGNATGDSASDDGPATTPEPPASYTLSGVIAASPSQTVDSDTNDPSRLPTSNDTPASAQPIPNPVTLGGYVSNPDSGGAGDDPNDFYRVQLLAGQRVTMLVADFAQGDDADLQLWNAEGTEVIDFSKGTGEVETLIVGQDGTYLVHAMAFSGATNYILAIGASNLPAQFEATQAEIVPWQAVVKYRSDIEATDDSSSQRARLAQDHGLRQRAGGRGRGRLMALSREQPGTRHRRQRLGAGADLSKYISDPDLRARWETLVAIKSLQQDPLVEYAEPNYRVTATAIPDDPGYALQWHYPLIDLPQAWNTTSGDSSVVVAVIDTGILPQHPDLADQLEAGYDFVSDPTNDLDGENGIDPNPWDPGSSLSGGSNSFHGTHIGGTVAAKGNNGQGVTGVAYSARIMPVRALGVGGAGTSYDVEQAVRYAAGLDNDSGTVPQQAADIINLSLGGAAFEPRVQDLFRQIHEAGIPVVAAAGNQATAAPTYPAAYAGVISVSAVDAQRSLAPYSNTGAHIDVAAPGGNNSLDLNGDGYPDGVLSTGGTFNDNGINYGYPFLNGTSMAAPHVAGVLALMKSVNPALTAENIDTLLATGQMSDDLGPPGRDDQFGFGLINANRSVLAALELTGQSPANIPRLVASASALNFGSNRNALDLALTNGGTGALTLTGLSTSRDWLSVVELDVDEHGLGSYRVNVDRSQLTTGVYSAEINARSSVNNLTVRVLLSVGDAGSGADVGVIYILLYDPQSGKTLIEVKSDNVNAHYPFSFSKVPPGEYEIAAGSDADNDGYICDPGEACGAWLSVDQPIRILVDRDMTDLDFPVEYLVSIPGVTATVQEATTATGIARPIATGED